MLFNVFKIKAALICAVITCVLFQPVFASSDLGEKIIPIIFMLSLDDNERVSTPSLNDTGITWGGNHPSGNNTGCTGEAIAQQDCSHGRDATHNDNADGHAGFSFTKLDANGNALANQGTDYTTTPWSCVQDNVTGLMWEVKTDDNTEHNKDNTYRWGGVTAQGINHASRQGAYYADWNALVNYANNNTLCGHSDWRVPSHQELLSITHLGTTSPAIDTDYFPNTRSRSSSYWSSSPSAYNSNYAWGVRFYGGVGYDNYRTNYNHVRLVR